ncbi:MAG: 5-formyltetrahydrofolate cyclo-ligase [Actinomycetota bacterium]|nr:5-formyltetrahydrofolate cyclo-ligase [Actinomycetota bacterium]
MLKKRSLRKDILEQRNNQGSKEMMKKSKKIEERLFEMTQFKEAWTIMFYASFKSEVRTESMIRKALALGKRVVLPILETQSGELDASRIQDFDQDLQPGAYGILEPKQTQPVDALEIDMVILPGIVFDERGHRLGYGGGCYDRFLNKINPQTILVGLAYELQLVNEVPTAPHDIPVHKIVTEERIIDCLPVGRHGKGEEIWRSSKS